MEHRRIDKFTLDFAFNNYASLEEIDKDLQEN